ncbi:unnamed protein product, partial [Laminaria digitata]
MSQSKPSPPCQVVFFWNRKYCMEINLPKLKTNHSWKVLDALGDPHQCSAPKRGWNSWCTGASAMRDPRFKLKSGAAADHLL